MKVHLHKDVIIAIKGKVTVCLNRSKVPFVIKGGDVLSCDHTMNITFFEFLRCWLFKKPLLKDADLELNEK